MDENQNCNLWKARHCDVCRKSKDGDGHKNVEAKPFNQYI